MASISRLKKLPQEIMDLILPYHLANSEILYVDFTLSDIRLLSNATEDNRKSEATITLSLASLEHNLDVFRPSASAHDILKNLLDANCDQHVVYIRDIAQLGIELANTTQNIIRLHTTNLLLNIRNLDWTAVLESSGQRRIHEYTLQRLLGPFSVISTMTYIVDSALPSSQIPRELVLGRTLLFSDKERKILTARGELNREWMMLRTEMSTAISLTDAQNSPGRGVLTGCVSQVCRWKGVRGTFS